MFLLYHIAAKLQSKKINVTAINQGKLYLEKLPQNATLCGFINKSLLKKQTFKDNYIKRKALYRFLINSTYSQGFLSIEKIES